VDRKRTSVGLDVHARSVVACGLDGVTGELFERRLTPDHGELLGWLQGLPGPVDVLATVARTRPENIDLESQTAPLHRRRSADNPGDLHCKKPTNSQLLSFRNGCESKRHRRNRNDAGSPHPRSKVPETRAPVS
jgi:hypothetical protein